MDACSGILVGSPRWAFIPIAVENKILTLHSHRRASPDHRFLLRENSSRNSDLSLPWIRALPITDASSARILLSVAFCSCPGALPRGLLSPFCGQAACRCFSPALHSHYGTTVIRRVDDSDVQNHGK